MRLTLIISSLSSGGAERVMSMMANYWSSKGWDITLLTFNDSSQQPFYTLERRISHLPLNIAEDSTNIWSGLWNNIKRIRKLRVAICDSKPDAIISFTDKINIITLLATTDLNIPVIISERTNPNYYSIGKIWDKLRFLIYPKANCIIVQTREAKDYFPKKWQNYIDIIPNPVFGGKDVNSCEEMLLPQLSIIAIGRLGTEKGFDILIKAFSKLCDSYPQWSLTILGEGSLRSELQSLSSNLGIDNRVFMPGKVKNVYDYLQQADLFVMSSRFEGFPNALCEAMACGLPVISTDCPSGPRNIIREGIDGVLVNNEDVDALSAAMADLMSNEGRRKELGTRAMEVTERFSLEKVMKMWEDILKVSEY